MWLVRCFCETQRAAFVCRLLAWSNDAAELELGRGVDEWMSGWWRAKVKLPLPASCAEAKQEKSNSTVYSGENHTRNNPLQIPIRQDEGASDEY